MKMLSALMSAALVLGLGAAAHAADYVTPFVRVNVDHYIYCTATNTGTTTAPLKVELIDSGGAPLAFNLFSCGATLPPAHTCYVSLLPGQKAYCHVTSSSTRLRVGINVLDLSAELVTVVPATR